MAKRSSTSQNEALKKQKVEDFGDFWDDDLDVDGSLIDECFEQATQEVSKARANVTILPSYSFFKETNQVVFTSTQVSQLGHNNVEHALKELHAKCAEKEGEVCILRANLQNLRTSYQLEQEKKDNEWKNKISATQKENKTIKSELEFKNLEIANLKQQIFELSKCVNIEQTTQHVKPTDNKTSVTNQHESVKDFVHNSEIQINSARYYPLKHIDFSCIFKSQLEEKHVIKNKYNLHKGTISYLQNHLSQDDSLSINAIEQAVSVGKKDLNLNSVYPELAYLVSLSQDEIDSAASLQALIKVTDLSLQHLTEFHNYLKEIEDRIQVQDVQESDSLYLQGNYYKNVNHNCDNSSDVLGTKAGKLVGFLAEIFSFNTYLRKCILQGTSPSSEFAELLESQQNLHYLTLILNTVTAIGKTRRERVCSAFLSSVIKFLSKIYNYGDFSEAKDLVCEITKEILFLRTDVAVILDIIVMLQAASKTTVFIDCICLKPTEGTSNNRSNNNKATKGILYFSREYCRFHMFVILLENILPKIEDEKMLLNISSNILNVVFNIFQMNDPWLYQQENKWCICLCQLYKLGISIIYRNLKMFQERSRPLLYIDFFKKSINILSLLIFNSYELTQKYVTNFAQFKEIVYTLSELHSEIGLDEYDVKSLEKLNTVEDVPVVSDDKFIGLDL